MIVRIRQPGETSLVMLGAVLLHDDVTVVIPACRPCLDWLLRAVRAVVREASLPDLRRRIGIEAVWESELSEEMRSWIRDGGLMFSPCEGDIQLAGRRSRGMDDYDHQVDDGWDLVVWLEQRLRERQVAHPVHPVHPVRQVEQ